MTSYPQASTSPSEQTTIIMSGTEVNSRLREIRERIARLGDAVHGPSLKATEGQAKEGPPPTNSIRRNLTVAFGVINEIESELVRLENNLS